MIATLLPALVFSNIDKCPGEGPRYGDYRCNHDGTHRVCAQLVNATTAKPLQWGAGDFWEITGQKAFEWSDQIVSGANAGDSWCICMWATASLIKQVGCDNVHLHCGSTDVEYVLSSYHDGGMELSTAHECLTTKCPKEAAAAKAAPQRGQRSRARRMSLFRRSI